jgi:adenylosuccinate synthase
VIGNGLAVDPLKLSSRRSTGLTRARRRRRRLEPAALFGAHVIFEHHKRIDHAAERWRGVGRIGTTGRGIGPCYADKAARTGLRVADLLEPERCRVRLAAALAEKNALSREVHGEEPLSISRSSSSATCTSASAAAVRRRHGRRGARAYRAGKRILFEGAQGAMLDLDHGTYPYVTSSNTGTDGIASGAGFPRAGSSASLGIAKAYCTRVGEGPFPSEDNGARRRPHPRGGQRVRRDHGPAAALRLVRRTAMRYTLELNGADGWIMTNLDVLTGFERDQGRRRLRGRGQRYREWPASRTSFEDVEVDFESSRAGPTTSRPCALRGLAARSAASTSNGSRSSSACRS